MPKTFNILTSIITFLNQNQGLIETIGLCFIIPAALLTNVIIEITQKHSYRKHLRNLLLRELLLNMEFVSQIKESYESNLQDDNLHIPLRGSRVSIIEKYLEYNILNALEKNEKIFLVEIFEGLRIIDHEFYHWRDLLLSRGINKDKELYKILSGSLVYYIKPTLTNMLNWWIDLTRKYGSKSDLPFVIDLNKHISDKTKLGQTIEVIYKSSDIDNLAKDERKHDEIICWIHDKVNHDKNVIEIKKYLDQLS